MYVIDLTHYLAPSPRSEVPPASSPNSSPPWWPTRQTAFALTRRPDRLALSAANAPGALSLLSESLRDPDVTVRATLRYSPDPNPVQRQSFARAYLEADRPADALRWLQDGWGHLEDGRLGLRAEALEKLGQFEASVPIRGGMFEQTMSDFYLDLWLQHLPEGARPQARDHARELALAHPTWPPPPCCSSSTTPPLRRPVC